jgi:hypothetical protein
MARNVCFWPKADSDNTDKVSAADNIWLSATPPS